MEKKNILWRRKKKFINAKVQLSIALQLLVYAFVFFLLVIVVMFVPPMAGWFNPGLDHQILMHDFMRLLTAKWPLLLLIVVVFAVYGNFFSHRIVGPGYRFKQILQSLIDRDLNIRFKLRRLDYHKELERYFKEHIGSLKNNVLSMRKNADSAIEALNSGDANKAKGELTSLKEELYKYKIEDDTLGK